LTDSEKRNEKESSPENEGSIIGVEIRKLPTSRFKRGGLYGGLRDEFAKSVLKFGKESLRLATNFAELNFHLNKSKPKEITKTFPLCLMAEKTIDNFI
jgi:hypothetical protein